MEVENIGKSEKGGEFVTSTLFPQMAYGALQPLLDRLDDREQQAPNAVAELTELLAGCAFGTAVLEQQWTMINAMIGHGVESGRLRRIVQQFGEALDRIHNEAIPKVQALAANAAIMATERQNALRALVGHQTRLLEMKSAIRPITKLLDRPLPQIDPAIFRDRDVAGPHRYLDITEVLDQLRGEDSASPSPQ